MIYEFLQVISKLPILPLYQYYEFMLDIHHIIWDIYIL